MIARFYDGTVLFKRLQVDADHSPAGWGDIGQSLDLAKAHIVKRSGRDVIALESTQNGFDLYFCDSPDGADHYDVTIAIPKR